MQVLTVRRSRYPLTKTRSKSNGKISKQERHTAIIFIISMCLFGGFTFSFLIASNSAPFLSIFNAPDQLVVKNDLVGIHSYAEGDNYNMDALFFDLVSLKQIESFSFSSASLKVLIYTDEIKLCELNYNERINDLGSMLEGSSKSFGMNILNNQNADQNLDPDETVQFYLFFGQSVTFQTDSHVKIVIESSDYGFQLDFKIPSIYNSGFSIVE
ncbi:hypothetical protein WKT22_00705 [Candidatus Lokiarchaeum ossiferum]